MDEPAAASAPPPPSAHGSAPDDPRAGTAAPTLRLAGHPPRRPAKRRWAARLGILVLLAGGAFALRETVFAPAPVEVKVVAVAPGRVEATVANTRAGTVRARRRARLVPETAGRVVEIPHREGQRVAAGAVLLRLADETQRARLEVARKALEAAEALLAESAARRDRAISEQTRARHLAASGVLTADELERAENAVLVALASCDTATARAAQARAEVQLAEAELRKCTLRAPFPGVIAEVGVELGEWITPTPALASSGVIDLIDVSTIYVSAPMDEVDSAVIRAGQPARVSVDPLPEQSFPGRVRRVAPYVLDVEAQNRTVEIEVELDDAEVAQGLLPGTSADVEVILEAREGVLRIPAAALFSDDRVLVYADGILRERRVEVGLRNWDFAEVRSGLAAGERVVTTLGKEEVRDGALAVVAAADAS